MRTRLTVIMAGIGAAVLAIAAVAAIQIGTSDATAQGGQGHGNGYGGGDGERGAAVAGWEDTAHIAPDTATTLTAEEIAGLRYMREEEKLAHDAYTVLGAMYESRVFANIARSETRHATTVKGYLDAFKIDDPAAGLAAGEFQDDELQALYTDLVAQGGTSLADAIDVGIAIEKRDIADLEARIAATDREDLRAMYGSLLRASENHLRAFSRQLDGPAATGGGLGGGQGQGNGQGRGQGQGGQGSCY